MITLGYLAVLAIVVLAAVPLACGLYFSILPEAAAKRVFSNYHAYVPFRGDVPPLAKMVVIVRAMGAVLIPFGAIFVARLAMAIVQSR